MSAGTPGRKGPPDYGAREGCVQHVVVPRMDRPLRNGEGAEGNESAIGLALFIMTG